jgi:hypothetical protein
VFDTDGSAVVIHAKADDYKSDPAGNAGNRIARGVITESTAGWQRRSNRTMLEPPFGVKSRRGRDGPLIVTSELSRFALSAEIQTPSGPLSIDSLIVHDQTDPWALHAAAGILGDIRHDEERATSVDPTRGLQNGAGLAIGLVQLVVSSVGVGLENPCVVSEVGPWMFRGAVARVVKHRRRRRRASERAIVAQVNPTPPGVGLALGQDG